MARRRIDLDRIIFIGRTFHEYFRMFDLDYELLREGRVLDCPGGASSFTAECARLGYDVKACDILYGMDSGSLIEKACADTAYALEQAWKVKDLFDWGFYGSAKEHAALRMGALKLFSDDFPEGVKRARYVAGELPRLPIKDDAFTLVLSSHFLFLYGDRLDYHYNLNCLREMSRVGGQVRVYPLVGLNGRQYPHLDKLISALKSEGMKAAVRKVPFRFMEGADRMLVING